MSILYEPWRGSAVCPDSRGQERAHRPFRVASGANPLGPPAAARETIRFSPLQIKRIKSKIKRLISFCLPSNQMRSRRTDRPGLLDFKCLLAEHEHANQPFELTDVPKLYVSVCRRFRGCPRRATVWSEVLATIASH